MEDLSSIIEMVLSMHDQVDTSGIINERNLNELDFVRHLLIIKTNPDYEEGMDERTDAIIADNPLSCDFLRGLKVALLMSLAAEPIFGPPTPHRKVLVEMYTMADAIILEQSIATD